MGVAVGGMVAASVLVGLTAGFVVGFSLASGPSARAALEAAAPMSPVGADTLLFGPSVRYGGPADPADPAATPGPVRRPTGPEALVAPTRMDAAAGPAATAPRGPAAMGMPVDRPATVAGLVRAAAPMDAPAPEARSSPRPDPGGLPASPSALAPQVPPGAASRLAAPSGRDRPAAPPSPVGDMPPAVSGPPEPIRVAASADAARDVVPARSETFLVPHAPPSVGPRTRRWLEEALRARGWTVSETVPVPFAIDTAHLRYYHEADAGAARALADALGAGTRDFTAFRPSPRAGLIEIWMSGRPDGEMPERVPPR